MGFAPQQVDAMTLWELEACAAGYARAHGGTSADPLTDDQMAKLEALGEKWNREARNAQQGK